MEPPSPTASSPRRAPGGYVNRLLVEEASNTVALIPSCCTTPHGGEGAGWPSASHPLDHGPLQPS